MITKEKTPPFDLEGYLTDGVEAIVKNALRATLKDPRESAFMARYTLASKTAAKRRAQATAQGEHIPPFLIASITSSCNLHCAGCYARHNHACTDSETTDQLTGEEWTAIFQEARELGIGFILLAGGEPLLRRDVLEAAGDFPEILFPVFTNGTMLDEAYTTLFHRCRNLIPVLSIEGQQAETDARRGNGVYQALLSAMDRMAEHHLLFGASVTVTRDNLPGVTSRTFLDQLEKRGCKVVFYVEYVPVEEASRDLAPQDPDRELLRQSLDELRQESPDMLFLSFPGDEKNAGGCLAAGRGFFHINAQGGAEPCPFSPYSDCNVKELSLRGALASPLFAALQESHMLLEDHAGGCVLFERREDVERLAKNGRD